MALLTCLSITGCEFGCATLAIKTFHTRDMGLSHTFVLLRSKLGTTWYMVLEPIIPTVDSCDVVVLSTSPYFGS